MALLAAVSLIISSVVANAAFKFEKGDNVCLIGNSLPDRFNHDGWFEAVLQSELKGQEVIFRNLGFTGDTVKRDQEIRDSPLQRLTSNYVKLM